MLILWSLRWPRGDHSHNSKGTKERTAVRHSLKSPNSAKAKLCAADCVHRVGPDLLEKQLPKRHEFAIFFQLNSQQEALYMKYLSVGPSQNQKLLSGVLNGEIISF